MLALSEREQAPCLLVDCIDPAKRVLHLRAETVQLLPLTSHLQSSRRDLPLDGLRGLCAALVFYAHAFAPSAALDPRWAPPPQFWWLNLGYAAVMMFFVLSGYVIGLTTTGPATAANARRYLSRRALRLLPVNTAAVLLAWAVLPTNPVGTVLANLGFLQNSEAYPGGVIFGLLPNNTNLWSLNYEAVYYLAFLAWWRWAPRAAWVWSGLALLALASPAGLPVTAQVSHYACGGLYWFAGLAIARQSNPAATASAQRGNWPAAFLGLYALWTLAPFRHLTVSFEWYPLIGLTPASIHRLDFLLACVWCLLAVSGRAPSLQRWFALLTLGWSTAGLFITYAIEPFTATDWLAATALTAAWLLVRWIPEARLLARLAPLGAVSFGIYAFALPIQFAQQKLFPEFSGSPLTFITRLAVLGLLTVGLAWVVERKLTPWLRRRLLRSSADPHTVIDRPA